MTHTPINFLRVTLCHLALLVSLSVNAADFKIITVSNDGVEVASKNGLVTLPVYGIGKISCGNDCSKITGFPYGDVAVVEQGMLINESVRGALVRNGFAYDLKDTALFGYLEEAVAMRTGVWSGIKKTTLFDSVAKKKNINPDILYALAMNESRKGGTPHPWTINVSGKGYYFGTREEAWRAANWLLKKKVTSFDVGLMQVNWKYHGHRFNSLWDAFQPSTNIEVAAEIVLENYKATNDWGKAVTWYHNRVDKQRGRNYFKRFVNHFNKAIQEREFLYSQSSING